MIRLTDDQLNVGGVALGGIWIGDSADERATCLKHLGIGAILCVAQDMKPTQGWDKKIESMHIGLIDGPGNELSAYCAAVLALHALLKRHNTMVCCHTGSRSLAVIVMYLAITKAYGWDTTLGLLIEKANVGLPDINEVHRKAYMSMSYESMMEMMGDIK